MNNVNKKLEETYRLTNRLFPNISKSCKDCNSCCKTYGWLLKQEANKFSKKRYSIVKINKNFYCFDSFIRNKNGKIIFDQIPRCLFYKKGECLIYKERPLDCRLYPIKMKFKQDKVIIGLSLGCKHISSLTKKEKKRLYYNAVEFFKKAPQNIINDYINLMENVNSVSKSKKFWMKEIIEVKKQSSCWMILK